MARWPFSPHLKQIKDEVEPPPPEIDVRLFNLTDFVLLLFSCRAASAFSAFLFAFLSTFSRRSASSLINAFAGSSDSSSASDADDAELSSDEEET